MSNVSLSARKKQNRQGFLKKIVKKAKFALLITVLVIKLGILLNIFNSAIHFKLLLISVANLANNMLRTWISYKHQPHTTHLDLHNHHFDEDFDEFGSSLKYL